ncbi:MAG TPA: flagellar basal-body rod protein FlgF [Firmicutes bacterium]|nr:flagellar basal-body rod protein FlgF [Candidatus Fermentithermobacillaceae bacterium]
MMRSLFSAVSGLRTHQTRMDVIGNNVANVNTPGFKSSRVTFQEVFSQTLRGAGSPSGTDLSARGGTNPMQVGLGVTVGSIDINHTSGNLQPTSRMTDVAIEGKGFFIVMEGGQRAYTRVGAFNIDGDGVLVDPEGRKVLGWLVDPATGQLPVQRPENLLQPIRIALGSNMEAKATENVSWYRNLNAQADAGFYQDVPFTVYDSQGGTHTLVMRLTKVDPADETNAWDWAVYLDPNDPSTRLGDGRITFDLEGKYSGVTGNSFTYNPSDSVASMTITLDFSKVTQVAGPTTVDTDLIDGHPTGTLESFTFDSRGIITGFYSNGQTRILGQIALANFPNPAGLQALGKNLYVESNNSGRADIGEAGTAGRGTIAPSSLEMSNVDLSEEFTQMIITQRGFQANSRIITVSDELLHELVNLKR